jgi:hypothetical protein
MRRDPMSSTVAFMRFHMAAVGAIAREIVPFPVAAEARR